MTPIPTVRKKPGPKPKPRPTAKPTTRPPSASKAHLRKKEQDKEANFKRMRAVAKTLAAEKKVAQNKVFDKIRDQALAVHEFDATVPVVSPERFLTEKMMMFVRHWAAGESILSASARAGYSDHGTMGYKLAKDPRIIKVYEREKKAYEASCQMSRKRVMDGFLEAVDMARIQADPTAMIAAWREVGKMCGYYEPVRRVIDVNVNGQITQKVERLDDETLLKIIKGEANGEVMDAVFTEVLQGEDDVDN